MFILTRVNILPSNPVGSGASTPCYLSGPGMLLPTSITSGPSRDGHVTVVTDTGRCGEVPLSLIEVLSITETSTFIFQNR